MNTPQEKHKDIVRHIHDQVNKGNTEVFYEHLSPNYARHCQAMPPEFQEMTGIEPLMQFVKECITAFPDWEDVIDYIIAEGDRVAYQTTSTATQARWARSLRRVNPSAW